jgi:type I restriction enzyme S subunit
MSRVWLDDWQELPFSELVTEMGDGGTPSTSHPEYFGGDVSWVVIEDIKRRITKTQNTLTELGLEKSNAKLWKKGSVILSTGATIGRVGITEIPVCTKQGVVGIECSNHTSSEFVYYLLEHHRDLLNQFSQGSTIREIRIPILSRLRFLIPPLKEQQKIAEILTSVDEVIENTQSQINKLEDLKKATMNELLTKGIGHTEFKDTGGGGIPTSWTLSRLEDVTERIWIGLVTTMTKFYSDSGVFLIRNSDIKEQGIATNDLIRLESNFANSFEDRKLRFNDVATVHTGDVGTSCVISESLDGAHGFATLNSRVTRARIFPNYYAMYLNSELFRRQTKKVVTGDGRDNLNLKDFVQLQIPVPDTLEEQVEIMRIYRGISDLIQGKKNKLESLNFLKHSLMHDLLTGIVRVTVN